MDLGATEIECALQDLVRHSSLSKIQMEVEGKVDEGIQHWEVDYHSGAHHSQQEAHHSQQEAHHSQQEAHHSQQEAFHSQQECLEGEHWNVHQVQLGNVHQVQQGWSKEGHHEVHHSQQDGQLN
jgi:hypothetical protein